MADGRPRRVQTRARAAHGSDREEPPTCTREATRRGSRALVANPDAARRGVDRAGEPGPRRRATCDARSLDVAERGHGPSRRSQSALLCCGSRAQALQKAGASRQTPRAPRANRFVRIRPMSKPPGCSRATMSKSGEFRASVTELERVLDASRLDPGGGVRALGGHRARLCGSARRRRARRARLPTRTRSQPRAHRRARGTRGHHVLRSRARTPPRSSCTASCSRRCPSRESVLARDATHRRALEAHGRRAELCAGPSESRPPRRKTRRSERSRCSAPGPWHGGRACRAGLDLLRARESAELLPTHSGCERANADSRRTSAPSWGASQVAAGTCPTSRSANSGSRPHDDASLTIEGVQRRARKKLKKALRNLELAPLREHRHR